MSSRPNPDLPLFDQYDTQFQTYGYWMVPAGRDEHSAKTWSGIKIIGPAKDPEAYTIAMLATVNGEEQVVGIFKDQQHMELAAKILDGIFFARHISRFGAPESKISAVTGEPNDQLHGIFFQSYRDGDPFRIEEAEVRAQLWATQKPADDASDPLICTLSGVLGDRRRDPKLRPQFLLIFVDEAAGDHFLAAMDAVLTHKSQHGTLSATPPPPSTATGSTTASSAGTGDALYRWRIPDENGEEVLRIIDHPELPGLYMLAGERPIATFHDRSGAVQFITVVQKITQAPSFIQFGDDVRAVSTGESDGPPHYGVEWIGMTMTFNEQGKAEIAPGPMLRLQAMPSLVGDSIGLLYRYRDGEDGSEFLGRFFSDDTVDDLSSILIRLREAFEAKHP